MIGQVFTTQHCGDVVVHEYKNRDNVFVTFLNTGTEIRTTKARLLGSDRPRLRDPRAPTVFGVGCIGVGPHKAHEKGADTKPFGVWRAMLRRCYYRGGKHHQPSYEGCSVAPEWHDFQTFAQWFEDNYPKDGGRYQLDKDTIVPGNKTYSPDRCRFVTQLDNLAARSRPGRGR
mgnify:CR=1 FL=1